MSAATTNATSNSTTTAANKTWIFKLKLVSGEPETLEAHWQR